MANALLFGIVILAILAAGTAAWLRLRPRTAGEPEPVTSWRLVLPRGASFSIAQAEAWFGALAPLLTEGHPAPSVEIRSVDKELIYVLTAPCSWEPHLRGQLAAWFPEARLERLPETPQSKCIELPLGLEKPDLFPIRVPADGEPDPLLGVIGALTQRDEVAGVRVTWGPPPGDWKQWAPAALAAARAGRTLPPHGWRFWVASALALLQVSASATGESKPPISSDPRLEGAAAKVRNPVFGASVAVWAEGEEVDAIARVREIAAAGRTGFWDAFGNSFAIPELVSASDQQSNALTPHTLTLSARELAVLFHVPDHDHPLVERETSRRVPPPVALVQGTGAAREPITYLGEALLPDRTVPFGLGVTERRLHTYVVGKTGTGKSTLLASILKQDLDRGYGVGLIDPHGDLAERALALVPPGRYDQVLYFNPADTDYPVGFNPLASRTVAERPLVGSAVVGVFKKLYGESWGPRLEYILRNAILALLETPAPSLLVLPRLLTDQAYRKAMLHYVRDPILHRFFAEEYENYDPRWRNEAISPILNKVGQFLSSPVVRHIVGQSGPGFNLRELMDEGGIFIANLASGMIGEDNTALLGGLLVASFQLAAMSRADQPEDERRDFFLCVDEFQHFANDAFGSILSEARKYRLSLTLSHQYLDQLPPEISDAVFGNAGSLCVFRVGAPDTVRLVRELAPLFDAQDLVNLPNYRFCTRINRRGETIPAFSARTVRIPEAQRDVRSLVENSRRHWSRLRAEVELEIVDLWEGRN